MQMSTLVTKQAPDFTATAVMPDNSFQEDFKLSSLRDKYVILFFYPLDFTFVCRSRPNPPLIFFIFPQRLKYI
ncbi:MAG: hypothetical protein D3923_18445, partial [Candidatus Electrothrix sp. AR3]|nr:hypothetical protein [Candidatus Electrothrix sp. AR3]